MLKKITMTFEEFSEINYDKYGNHTNNFDPYWIEVALNRRIENGSSDLTAFQNIKVDEVNKIITLSIEI